MNSVYFNKSCKWLCLIIFLVSLDAITKYWVQSHFILQKVYPVLPGINWYYVYNFGLAFGLFSNIVVYYLWIIQIITLFIVVIFIYFLYRSIRYSIYDNISYSMIIGGGLGNLYDRMFYGMVIDFIDIYCGDWHWPTFNVADMEIVIGILMLMIRHFYNNC